ADGDQKSGKLAFLKRLFSYRILAFFLLATVIFQGTLFGYYQFGGNSSGLGGTAEVSLGTFHFSSNETEEGRVSYAKFDIYIALLGQVDAVARQQLATRQFRLQQDIEELLRRTQSGDFDDPNLGELKRQLQERINTTLKIRAIDDVIITNLTVKLNGQSADTPMTETPESVPWIEPSD
ncbi:MAG: flagellar basal body-associated FliL family protein, partial [Planctomycetales bacterium]